MEWVQGLTLVFSGVGALGVMATMYFGWAQFRREGRAALEKETGLWSVEPALFDGVLIAAEATGWALLTLSRREAGVRVALERIAIVSRSGGVLAPATLTEPRKRGDTLGPELAPDLGRAGRRIEVAPPGPAAHGFAPGPPDFRELQFFVKPPRAFWFKRSRALTICAFAREISPNRARVRIVFKTVPITTTISEKANKA